jgi:hypothetical protein
MKKDIGLIFVELLTILLLSAMLTSCFVPSVNAATVMSYNLNISNPNDSVIIESNIVTSSSALLIINTNIDSTCRYSQDAGVPYELMPQIFDMEYGALHKKTLTGLTDGQVKSYIKCKDTTNNVSKELNIVFQVDLPVSAQITFDNGPNLKDGKAEFNLVTSKIVNDAPTLSYTTDGINYKPVPIIGSGTSWGGYLIIPSSSEATVGSFKFQARDLEGNIGTDIASGTLFTIDTIPPNQLLDIRAENNNNKINLTWRSDEDGLRYNIYRSTSPGVSYSDFYKTVQGSTYIDNNVVSGNTYYYKMSGVDDAGNEGSLSTEVYATPSFLSSTSSTTLDLAYVGMVDKMLQNINSLSSSINSISSTFNAKVGIEEDIFQYMKLSTSIDSAKSSLDSLNSEVSSYKLQPLTKDEITKKLNSAQVKLDIIKTNMPESLTITNHVSIANQLNENDISAALLDIKPGTDYTQLSDLTQKSLQYYKDNNPQINGTAYEIEVNYVDGTQKQFTLVKKEINFNPSNSVNTTIIEVIPKEMAQSTNDLDIYGNDYSVIKDDPVLSFTSDTKEIVYFVKGNIDNTVTGKTQTIIFEDQPVESGTSTVTGYFSFIGDATKSNTGVIIIIGVIIILSLTSYLWSLKRKSEESDDFVQLKSQITDITDSINQGDSVRALHFYKEISEKYKRLKKDEKTRIYTQLQSLHGKVINLKSQIQSNLKNKGLSMIIGISIAVILILSSFAFAATNYNSLMKGENKVMFDREMMASDIVAMNPNIESITYNNEFLNQSYAFLNVFGGIGKNFIIVPGEEYEVNSKSNISLNIQQR